MPVLTERRAACVAAAQRVRRARRVRRASSVVRVLGAGGVEQRAELEVRVLLSAWAVTARHSLVSRVPGRSKGCFPYRIASNDPELTCHVDLCLDRAIEVAHPASEIHVISKIDP